MVHLDRIYTRGGDGGQTSLGDGSRVPKTDARIEAYGTVDELNTVLGLALEAGPDADQRGRLTAIQDDLLDVGAELCLPGQQQRLADGRTERLERWIDQLNEDLAPLTSFVLPGARPPSGALHLARTVCRRCERRVLGLLAAEPDGVHARVPSYLNRLSDLLFVEARVAAGAAERTWTPGGADAPNAPSGAPEA
ncbi:MAG: cob(I)yrinic acid a,c-diamide adenosyltransferase [Planctomycetota bacterium]|nr:MAG: cob(I)yrinic acid a,c-diamide adenosyltransferase [Planctomycetota bacterium]